MQTSTQITRCHDFPATELTTVGRAKHVTTHGVSTWAGPGVGLLVPRFSGEVLEDTSVVSEVAETNRTKWAAFADAESRYTTAWDVDPYLIAAILARVGGVNAVYVRSSPGTTHVWTVLDDDGGAVLDAVFEQELVLHNLLGQRLASVEFHVLSHDATHALDMGDRIFQRVRQ